MIRKLKIFFLLPFLFSLAAESQTLKDALRLTDNEQYDEAKTAFQKIIKREPQNVLYYFYAGDNLLLMDKKNEAIESFQKGLQVEPDNAINLVGMGKAFLLQNIADEAKTYFDKALLLAPTKVATIQIEIADAYLLAKKNLEESKALLDKAASIEPKNPQVYVLMGDYFSEKNDGTNAAVNYNKALDLDICNKKALLGLGKLYKRTKNYPDAVIEFKECIVCDKAFAPAHRELSEVYYLQRLSNPALLDSACEECKKYAALSNNNCSVRKRYASFLYLLKKYPDAIAEMKDIKLDCDSSDFIMQRIMSYCLFETGSYTEALTEIKKFFEKTDPAKIIQSDYLYYGRILSKNNQDSLGAIQLSKGYSMDTSQAELILEIANQFFKIKKYGDAAVWFKKKIDSGKDLKANDYYMLGKSYFFNNDHLNADSAFAKLTEVSNKWPPGFQWRAQNLTYLDDTIQSKGLAKPHYEKYIEVTLGDTTVTQKYIEGLIGAYGYLASYYLFVEKDKTKAVSYFRKKLELLADAKERKKIQDYIDYILNPPKQQLQKK